MPGPPELDAGTSRNNLQQVSSKSNFMGPSYGKQIKGNRSSGCGVLMKPDHKLGSSAHFIVAVLRQGKAHHNCHRQIRSFSTGPRHGFMSSSVCICTKPVQACIYQAKNCIDRNMRIHCPYACAYICVYIYIYMYMYTHMCAWIKPRLLNPISKS